MDIPNSRSSHHEPVVRGAGFIFYISMLIYWATNNFQHTSFIIGLTIVAIPSMYDDLYGLSRSYRILAHFIGIGVSLIGLELGFPVWGVIFYLIIAAGILNGFNFMDGINGLTAGYGLVIMGTLLFVNQFKLPFIDDDIIIYALIAFTVFAFFNFRTNAKCFAGDIGAISTAFIIVYVGLNLILYSNNYSYILFLTVYGIDSIGTIVERLIRKEDIFEAHRAHLYQLMANQWHIPQIKISIGYLLLQLLINLVVINWPNHFLLHLAIVTLLILIYTWVKIRFFKVLARAY